LLSPAPAVNIMLRHIKFAIEYNALFMRFYITYELCGVKMELGKH
jgi:hypothetical protein